MDGVWVCGILSGWFESSRYNFGNYINSKLASSYPPNCPKAVIYIHRRGNCIPLIQPQISTTLRNTFCYSY